jgi:hypothetical protein
MKAYILRRMLLISEEASNVLVLGSLNSANTLRCVSSWAATVIPTSSSIWTRTSARSRQNIAQLRIFGDEGAGLAGRDLQKVA